MDCNGKSTGVMSHFSKVSENVNPNVGSPGFKPSKSPMMAKSAAKTQKSVSRNPNPNPNPSPSPNQLASPSPKNKIRQRKFVIAKKKNSKTDNSNPLTTTSMACSKCNKAGVKKQKCLCVAYETLRASQEEFFKNRGGNEEGGENEMENLDNMYGSEIGDAGLECNKPLITNELEDVSNAGLVEMGVSTIKRTRDKLMEEARRSVPESGKVMHLVKAFEKLLSVPKTKESENKGEEDEKETEESSNGQKWALPGLQLKPPKAPATQVSSSSFCPSDFFLTSESLGLDARSACSLDSTQGSFNASSRTSGGGRRSRRNSAESSGTFARRNWKRRTSLKPFKLRTEQRGKCKKEEFFKKVQQMVEEEKNQRIPIAQGLPWTTDEPECLPKPPVKECTRPIDLVLHSDIRAVERAEFDHQVEEKLSLIEQYKMERDRQQKMAEEEEVRRLRKELVPKAQPMPYFDRPFVPRRSSKNPTIPREPKFHIPQHKKIKCCTSWNNKSWNDMYIQQDVNGVFSNECNDK